MTAAADQATTQAPLPGRRPTPAKALIVVLVGVSVILLIAVGVLIVKMNALQDDVAALRTQTNSVSTLPVDPEANSNELDTCRLLGALAAKSKLTLASLFPDSTVGACEAAASDGYHQALSKG